MQQNNQQDILNPIDQGQYVELNADPRKRRFVVGWPWAIGLIAFSMLLQSLIQEPVGWSRFAWICLVPWVIGICGAKSGWKITGVNFAASFLFFMANLYWLIWVTWPGWLGLCFYLSLYFVLCGFILRKVYLKRRWPFTLVVPILWVGQEYLRSIVMTGFPWLFIGHSQYRSTQLIQAADLVGVYGVTFVVMMVNGLLCDILMRPLGKGKNLQSRAFLGVGPLVLITAVVGLGMIFYGQFRLKEGEQTIKEGPVVSVIQETIPQDVKLSGESNEKIFRRYMEQSDAALMELPKPSLMVWPETMVPAPINQEIVSITPEDIANPEGQALILESRHYNEQLIELAKRGVNLLVGSPTLYVNSDGEMVRYNSAELYYKDGSRSELRYDKMHLVPFGEVVPFKESWPWLNQLLLNLSPYNFDHSINYGEHKTVFEFKDHEENDYRFAVLICYEDVIPYMARILTMDEVHQKRVDFLVNISNDGWFTRKNEFDEIVATSEQRSHFAISVFRAIENRVGIARSVNTGISGFIRPDGVVQGKPLQGTLSSIARDRGAQIGYLTDHVYMDSRVTFYSKTGDLFAIGCTILSGIILIVVLVFKPKKAAKEKSEKQAKKKEPKQVMTEFGPVMQTDFDDDFDEDDADMK